MQVPVKSNLRLAEMRTKNIKTNKLIELFMFLMGIIMFVASKYNNLKLPTKREKVEQGMNELEVTNSKAFESFKRTNHHMPPNGFS